MTTPSMSSITDKTPIKLPIGIWLLLLCTVAGAGGGVAVAQYQINEHSRRIERLEADRGSDRELLLRIDERTGEIKRQVDRLAR